MPIYEYACRKCGNEFETITRGSERPSCPDCGGSRLDKRLSVFAVGAGGSDSPRGEAPSPCGSCGDPRGPGACALD